jgi:hypothetical protein
MTLEDAYFIGGSRSLLEEARDHERQLEWDAAAEAYSAFPEGKALGSDEAFYPAMRMGHCYERAAFRSMSAPDFGRRIGVGAEAHWAVETQVSFETDEIRHIMAKARRLGLQSVLSVEHEERVFLLTDAIGVQRIALRKAEPTTGGAYHEQVGFHLQLIHERSPLNWDEHVVPLLMEGLDLVQRLLASKDVPSDAELLARCI